MKIQFTRSILTIHKIEAINTRFIKKYVRYNLCLRKRKLVFEHKKTNHHALEKTRSIRVIENMYRKVESSVDCILEMCTE